MSKQENHTRGPWKVNRLGDKLYVEGGIRDEHGLCIEVQPWGESPTPEDLANARLIAAAPELLRACKVIVRRLGDQTEGSLAEEAIHLARAAIAKAGGGA